MGRSTLSIYRYRVAPRDEGYRGRSVWRSSTIRQALACRSQRCSRTTTLPPNLTGTWVRAVRPSTSRITTASEATLSSPRPELTSQSRNADRSCDCAATQSVGRVRPAEGEDVGVLCAGCDGRRGDSGSAGEVGEATARGGDGGGGVTATGGAGWTAPGGETGAVFAAGGGRDGLASSTCAGGGGAVAIGAGAVFGLVLAAGFSDVRFSDVGVGFSDVALSEVALSDTTVSDTGLSDTAAVSGAAEGVDSAICARVEGSAGVAVCADADVASFVGPAVGVLSSGRGVPIQ